MESPDEQICFELLGERFSIKSDVSKDYFLGLVSSLERKIRNLKTRYPALNSVKLLVLAALDLADELSQKNTLSGANETIERITALSDTLASVMDGEECG